MPERCDWFLLVGWCGGDEVNFKQATLAQLHLINSEFEDCPIWYKQMARDEIERRKKKVHNKIPNKNKIGRL